VSDEQKPADELQPGETLRQSGDEQVGEGAHTIRRDGRHWHHTRETSKGEWVYVEVRPRD
jgi:hypothetical protein